MKRYFWCEKHKQAHLQGEDKRDCLLVGPFSPKEGAVIWNRSVRKSKKRAEYVSKRPDGQLR